MKNIFILMMIMSWILSSSPVRAKNPKHDEFAVKMGWCDLPIPKNPNSIYYSWDNDGNCTVKVTK
jgi:hypothetical protein